jgi:hypothetical protein
MPRPPDNFRTVTEYITPERAQALLDKMGKQRPLRRSKVETLKRVALAGNWKLLPHGIVLDPDGKVLDGQHRLWMVVETGLTLPFRVTYDCPTELYEYIDSVQSPKTLDDTLLHAGVSSTIATACAMAVRLLFRRDLGLSPFTNSAQPSNDEGLETFYAHPVLSEAADLAVACKGVAPSRGVLAYVLYLGLMTQPAATREFAQKLATGENLKSGDPALLLRNTWMKERGERVKHELSDIGVQAGSALDRHLRNKPMYSWRGVEFGKGSMPMIGRTRPPRKGPPPIS